MDTSLPSYKQWVSRSRELSGFRDWAEKLGGWLCLIHDQYGPELREALRMEEPIVLLVADQELRDDQKSNHGPRGS